jgi:hypothetical protein
MLGVTPPAPARTVLDVIDAWTDRRPGWPLGAMLEKTRGG